MKPEARGKVYLVGAGPGDPDLITQKALRCIAEADVIVYDRLVNAKLLDAASPNAEKIYVGKSPGKHSIEQADINHFLVRKARRGKCVVRLKGGDPFLFGRGGEEAEALAAERIHFEVVPGVTAATAVPAYAGIPVTHRGLASSLAIVTGHEDPTKEESRVRWNQLATSADTIVLLMGLENLPQIAEQLISHGKSPATPVALVQDGTTPRQRTVVGTLEDIAHKAARSDLSPPVVAVIGSVVDLRAKLRWFDTLPLFGKTVLVTRARRQASRLSYLLAAQGAEVIELPTIEIKPTADYHTLDRALARLSEYDWIVFTSPNGVDAFFSRALIAGVDARALANTKLCAIGPATTEALAQHGLLVDYTPEEYVSEGIVRGLSDLGIEGKRMLLPRVEGISPDLSRALAGHGAHVDQIPVYRTVRPSAVPSEARQRLADGRVDITTFTSSSTVRNLATILGDDWPSVNHTTVACIGPVTAATATDLGLNVAVVAKQHTIPGLVHAILQIHEQSEDD